MPQLLSPALSHSFLSGHSPRGASTSFSMGHVGNGGGSSVVMPIEGRCLFPDGAWKLSGNNDNSWMSKIFVHARTQSK